MERIQEVFEMDVEGVGKVEWRTPGYVIRKKWQRGLLRTRVGKLVWSYEKKTKGREGKGEKLAREC